MAVFVLVSICFVISASLGSRRVVSLLAFVYQRFVAMGEPGVSALAMDSSDAELISPRHPTRRTTAIALVGGVTFLAAIAALAHGSGMLSSQHVDDAMDEYAAIDVDKSQPNLAADP